MNANMMPVKMFRIRILFWICLISTFFWWGSKSVKRYWNQPLTTNMVYSYGDNDNGIQFPLMTFCDREFVKKNKIFQDCKVWIKKDRTDILLNITKVIDPIVKTPARGQNYWSRALK